MQNKAFYKDAPEYAKYYFDQVETDDLMAEFEKSREMTLELLDSIPAEKENYAYQADKWTIKEVIQHIIDMERIFAGRAFRFSRMDSTELPGVEENDYAENVDVTDVSLADLREEYLAVRNATIWVFKNIKPIALDFKGMANRQTYTTRTLGFATIGHNIHHCNFIRSRYLNN